MRKLLGMLVLFLFGTFASAQYLSDVVRVDEDVVTLRVLRGFTPWDYWQAESNENVCGWSGYRAWIAHLNPAYTFDDFRSIPVGAMFHVPRECAALGSIIVVPREAVGPEPEALLDLEEAGLVLTGPETLGEVLSGIQDDIGDVQEIVAVLQEDVVALQEGTQRIIEDINEDETPPVSDVEARQENPADVFAWLPTVWLDWLLLFLIVALLAGAIVYRSRKRQEGSAKQERAPPSAREKELKSQLKEAEKTVREQEKEIQRLRDSNESLLNQDQRRAEELHQAGGPIHAIGETEVIPYEDEEGRVDVLVKHVEFVPATEKVKIVDRSGEPLHKNAIRREKVRPYLKKHKNVLKRVREDAAEHGGRPLQPAPAS